MAVSFRDQIMQAINIERARQQIKWGDQEHSAFKWMVILAEEVGEVAKAIFDGEKDAIQDELIQVAAVAVAWLEDIRLQANPRSRALEKLMRSRMEHIATTHPLKWFTFDLDSKYIQLYRGGDKHAILIEFRNIAELLVLVDFCIDNDIVVLPSERHLIEVLKVLKSSW